MSLPRYEDPRRTQSSPPSPVSTSPAKPPEQPPLPELEQLNAMILDIAEKAGATAEEAKRDERVCLLAAATLQMCRILQDYTVTTNAAMEKIVEHEMKNLSIQSQYAQSVRSSTVEIAREMHRLFANEQREAFQEVYKILKQQGEIMMSNLGRCAQEVRSATFAANESAEHLRTVKTIGDVLYHAAPILVLIDIILRVVLLVKHIG